MKYTCEVTLGLPRNRVVELFDSFENLTKWQPGLRSFEHLRGEAGQPGAKTKLVYDERGRKVEMIETIATRNLPDEFSGTYEANNVKNWIKNSFFEEGESTTRWSMQTEFQFSGFMAILSKFMRRAFPKQTLKDMNRFKDFAESQ